MDTDTAAKPNSLFPHPSINKEEGGTGTADPPTRPGAGTSTRLSNEYHISLSFKSPGYMKNMSVDIA